MKFNIGTLVLLVCGPLMVIGHLAKVTTTVQHTTAENPNENGFWQKQVSWKPRLVKYWRQKAVYIPIWKKVWGPVVHTEWIPIPKPPPDWQRDDEPEHSKQW